MQSWTLSVRALVATACGLVAVAGAVVGILAVLGVFDNDQRLLQIDSIGAFSTNGASPPQLMTLQEVDVIGKNLDRVLEASLSRGLGSPSVPVFVLPVDQSRLIMTIPSSVEPVEHNLEVHDELWGNLKLSRPGTVYLPVCKRIQG